MKSKTGKNLKGEEILAEHDDELDNFAKGYEKLR